MLHIIFVLAWCYVTSQAAKHIFSSETVPLSILQNSSISFAGLCIYVSIPGHFAAPSPPQNHSNKPSTHIQDCEVDLVVV